MNDPIQRLKALRFETPDYIPMTFHINDACWHHYDQDMLFDLMENHPFLFPHYKRQDGKYVPEYITVAQKDHPYTDDWGCVWETSEDGITGTVTSHPLSNWDDLDEYTAPNPRICTGIGPIDWDMERQRIEEELHRYQFAGGGLRHGHTFLQLCDIRGYQNIIYDMVDDHPSLRRLIEMIESFNTAIVKKYIDLGVTMMGFPEDLGMQRGPMVSPDLFRKFIKPSYQRMMGLARKQGIAIHMHSDGDLHDLIDDLIDGGVEAINLQDLVNDVDWIADRLAGKVCIDLDIDRQQITPYGTRAQIDELIRYEVEQLGSKQGGLMMIYGLYPGCSPESISYLMDAMEKYAFYYEK